MTFEGCAGGERSVRWQPMTIRVWIPMNAADRICFSLSPFMEAFWSLHILQNPGRHPFNQTWIREAWKRMADLELDRELREFAFAVRGSPTSCGVPLRDVAVGSFTDELARFRQGTPAEAARFFTRSFYQGHEEIRGDERVPPQVAERLLAHTRAIRASAELATRALEAPREVLFAFAELMERYWYSGFNEKWQFRVERLEREMRETEARIAHGSLADFLRTLPLDVRVEPNGKGFTVDRPHDHDVTIGEGDRLVLTPSVFVMPHVRISCERPGVVAIAYPSSHEVELIAPLPPPDSLLTALEALADDTRLRMLRHLSDWPKTTQQLSALVNVAPATVSSHLRKLEAAGLVTPNRDGHYVVYQLRFDAAQIIERLRSYLDDRLDPL
jgi:DNA-binding transcriptional ArsR family regulator